MKPLDPKLGPNHLSLPVLGASQNRRHLVGERWLETPYSEALYILEFEVAESFC